MLKKQILIEIISFLFIVLFLYSAGSKLLDYRLFIAQLSQSRYLVNFANIIAWGIPTLEVLIVIGLTVPKTKILGLYSSFALMLIFSIYIFILLVSNEERPCSCGGVLSMLGWTEHFIFNCIFTLLAFTAILLHPRTPTTIKSLSVTTLMCIGIMIGLYIYSNITPKKNRVKRSFLKNVIGNQLGAFKISNSNYIAGVSNEHIYLGDEKDPLSILILDSTFVHRIHLKDNSLKGVPGFISQAIVEVDSPYVVVKNGNFPGILVSHIDSLNFNANFYKTPYFRQSIILPNKNLAIITIGSTSAGGNDQQNLGKIVLGSKYWKNGIWNTTIFSNTDLYSSMGALRFNKVLNNFVFTYYFQNRYLILDNAFKLKSDNRTIDVFSDQEISTIKTDDSKYILASPISRRNLNSQVTDTLLFIQSDSESNNNFRKIKSNFNTVVDVYNLKSRV